MATIDKKGQARRPAVPPAYQPGTSRRPVQAKAAPATGAAATTPPAFKARASQRPRVAQAKVSHPAPRPAAAARQAKPVQAKMSRTIQMTRCPKCAQADLVADEFCMKCGYSTRTDPDRGQMTIMPGYPGGNVPVNEITHIGNKRVK